MKIVLIGAGMIGLSAAMLLAGDSHEVTVLERDPAPPPDPAMAWDDWSRRGVTQFRLPHLFLPRFRIEVEDQLPALAAELDRAGACRMNIIAGIPDQFKGGSRPGDEVYEMITGRRAVIEAATASVAAATPGVTIRRGDVVTELLTGPSDGSSIPNVIGVGLEDGEQLIADLVVDVSGRRSALPRWLEVMGAAPMLEETEDSGFVYYGRHFKSADGSLPFAMGPFKQDIGSIGVLTLPADQGTWSVTLTAASDDAPLRELKDPVKWRAVVEQLPLVAHWLDGTPIDDGVQIMARIEDRIRDFAPQGQPVVTGLLPLGDSWSCTNPSLGRGASVGLIHAIALRDLLREEPGGPMETAKRWSQITTETVEPWYRSTVAQDRHRTAQIRAIREGRQYRTDDPIWNLSAALEATATADGDHLRANLDQASVFRTSEEIFADESLCQRLTAMAADVGDQPLMGPDRATLLATVAG